jgi:hypothetical protein
MRVAFVVTGATLVVCATTQASGDIFEPQDFNVTVALEDIGIAVSMLPEPKFDNRTVTGRYLVTPCSLAVSLIFPTLVNKGTDNETSVLP